MPLVRFSRFDPFEGILGLQRELGRVFENPGAELGLTGRGAYPPVNAFRNKDGNIVVRLEIPGIDPASLSIETHGRALRISGKRETHPPAEAAFHRRERGTGEFSRVVQMPEDVDLHTAEATYRFGVLTVNVPKSEKTKPRQIQVQVH